MEEVNKRKKPASSKPFSTRQSEEKKRKYQQAQLAKSGQRTSSSGNWYSGDRPTRRETLARVYQLGMEDPSKRDRLMQLYDAEVSNPNSFLYDPYTKATSIKYTKTNINNTVAAQEEWARLSDELTYWAGRTDRNYSDDEIIGKINWDNYKTLQKMDAARAQGGALELLDAVGYSDDAMYGVLWAARNPNQSTGNAMYDAAKSALGVGNQHQRDELKAERLNPMSQLYNPYAVGSTVDDLAYKYRTDRFDDAWLAENRDLLLDADTAKDYGKIYDAVQNTKAIQAEAEALKQELARYAETGVQADFDYLLTQSEYKNLAKLQESLKSGQIIDTADVIDFDLPAMKAESEAAYLLKQAQLNAGKDLEAANQLAEEEKKGIVAWLGGLFQKDTTPKDAIEYPKPVLEESTEEIINEGAAVLGPVVQELAVAGDYTAAADAAQAEYTALLEQNPELLTTDNGQKGAMLMMLLANEAGLLTDPAAQEKAKSIQDTVAASMSVDMETEESKGLLAWLDEKLQTGGTLVAAQENDGLGLNTTLMMLWDRAMARGADWVENLVGQAVVGVGELIGSEDLINYGKENMETFDRQVAHYDTVLAENGTPLEILAAQQGSEMLHMMQLGNMSKAISQFNAIKTGGAVNFLTRVLMGTPFALESGGSTFQDTYSETDNYLTSLAAGTAATAVTSLLSQWDGILKNIEANGMPYLPEVVEKLGSIPGSGVKAGIARYGKTFGLWLMNGLKTVVNESVQEAAEGGATDILVDLIKGENLSEKDWAAFGEDRMAEAVGSVFLTMGSVASTMPTYARSAKVAQSQMHKSNVTIEDVNTFVTAVQADLQDPEIVAEMQERAQNIAVETRTGELIAAGALSEIDTSAVDAAKEAAYAAGNNLAEAEGALEASNAAMERANEKLNANPADDTAKNDLLKAIADQQNARKGAIQARDEASRAEEALATAQAEQAASTTEAMNAVREQARAEVTQNMAAAQEARLQQEAAAEVQRQNDNVLAMQADDFVNEYMADAPDDVKDQVRERYMAYDGETQNATRGMVEFASQISKKFGLNITFTDSHGIFEGAYKGGNDIVLDKNATQGEVIKRVLVHEITHAAESSEAYDALADAVLTAFYGENAEQMQADLDTIAKQYAEQVGQDGQSVARSELVAQRLSEMLSGNQEAMNRLVEEKPDVATRIWRAIKDLIGKLRGVRDPELDKLMKLEKQLEQALGSRTGSTSDTQFMIERGAGGVDVVVVEEDILDGVDKRDWPKKARSVMQERFPNGIPVDNNVVRITRGSRKEITNSKDSMWLKHTDFTAYRDKLRATANADELITASRDYVNEAPAHDRKDNIVDFARGEVTMRIGGREYDAEVIVGYTADGEMRLYDFVRMNRTDEKKTGKPFEEDSSRDSQADLSELSVSENEPTVKQVSFSLTSPVEKSKGLIATHALNFDNLVKQIKLGGFAGPSIAVSNVKNPGASMHYGDTSVVFGRNTVDPEADARNVLYSGDSFTPRGVDTIRDNADSVKYKVDSQKWNDLVSAAKEAWPEELDAMLVKTAANGKKQRITNDYSALALASGSEKTNTSDFESVKEALAQTLGVRMAYLNEAGIPVDGVMPDFEFTGDNAEQWYTELSKRIDDVTQNGKDVRAWVDQKLEGADRNAELVSGKTGRSYAYTPEGIVEKMHEDRAKGNNIQDGLFHGNGFWNATKEYKSLNEARKDYRRLVEQQTWTDKQKEHNDRAEERFFEARKAVIDETGDTSDKLHNLLYEMAEGGHDYKTIAEGFKAAGYDLKPSTIRKLQKAYKGLRNYYRLYYESKPDRPVGFDEVKMIVTPESHVDDLRTMLAEAGYNIEVVGYKDGDQGDRLAKLNGNAVMKNRFSLPSNDILDKQIAQHRNRQLAPAPNDVIPSGGEPAQSYGDGERQFAGQTIQNSAVVPDWIKQEFLRPEELNYETDTNREQVERSWQRIQENGYEAERDRLLSLDRYSADDTAEANLMMAMALREDTADPATFMALASHYNKEGTKAGQELQARKLFTRMSPTGARVWAAGHMESNLEEHMRTHRSQRERIDNAARKVADQIRDMQGGDELLRLNAGGDFTIDESNNRWGVPINEQQQALIDHYGLNNVARPGIFYNRATTQQRMLEAILATPNPLEVTGLGLNLIQRLEFMQDGEAVITNADLNYLGTQLGQFVALGEEAGGRAADLALARAYEAFGNITPATRMEKFRTQRYVNMLSTFTSFARNIIGNVGQNVANAAAHGIGVEIDRLESLRTGRRTMAHLSAAERIEGWKAFAEETKNTFLDFFVDKANTAPNRDKYSTNQRGRVFQSGALEMSKDIESFLMSVGDRNIWKKAFVNSMAEQQKLADRNQLFNDDGTTRSHEQMVEYAEAAANYATFTEDSLVQDVMQFIRQRNPAAADVLSLYMPFTGVPHNIMKRNFQYSPIGFLTMAVRRSVNKRKGRNFDQYAFVNDLSRALTGTGGVLMGVVLGLAGAIKMGTEDEQKDKVYDVETALGEQYTPYVYDPTTDTYVSMSTFAPAASPLVWGAAIGQQLKNDEFNANVLLSALSSSVDSIFDASYLSGLSDLFGGYGSFTENLAHVTAENLASQLTPAFLNQVANAMDPYVRDTKDKDYLTELMKTTLNRIPILRNKLLPEKVTVAGENVPTKQGWSLVDPFTRTNPSDNAALIEVKRLYDAVGDTAVLPSDALRSRKNSLTLNKKSVTLNDQQKAEYKKYYGDLWAGEVSALMATTAYQLMDDEERAEKVEKIMTDALKRAKKEFIDRYGE